MEDVYLSKIDRFCNIFRAVAHEIAEGISTSQYAVENEH